MRKDHHNRQSDAIVRSDWYCPNGELVFSAIYTDGNGLELYLDEDGNIEKVVPVRGFVAEGRGVYLEKDGRPLRVIEFRNGIAVHETEYKK